MTTTPPIRLTKRRAEAMLQAFHWGIESERRSIEEAYGVQFNKDGTLNLSEEEFSLFSGDEASELMARLEDLTDALSAAVIFRRRYA